MAVDTPHAEWRREQPVIDAHTHLDLDHVDDALRYMEQNGLEMLVDISPWNVGERFERVMDLVEEHPDRFAAYSGIDFDGFGEDGWIDRELERIETAVERGAVGIKLWKHLGLVHTDPDGNVFPVDDDRLAPLFELAGELDTVVAFHVADPKAFFEPLDEENERWAELGKNPDWWFGDREQYPYDWWQLIRQLERVIERHPETTFLGAHWGCAAEEVGYVADVMRENPNYVVDVSARLPEIGRHRPDLVHDFFVEFQDRIIFGTDLWWESDQLHLGSPQEFEPTAADVEAFYDAHWRYFETADEGIAHPTPIQGDWTIDAIDLPRAVLAKLYAENARRYLGL